MPIEGPLKELGIHDVFQLLDVGRKSGRLRITSDERQRGGTICLQAGAVVNARVDDLPFDLGATLLEAGRITGDELAAARHRLEAGDGLSFGAILVQLRAVSQREIERQVRRQIEDTVFELMGWSEGYFVYEEAPCELPPAEWPVRIPIESLLLEGARRIDEWSRIASVIPGVDVIPAMQVADDPEPKPLDLTPFEWEVLTVTDGERSVAEIARGVGRSEFDVARTLFGLASAGVIVLTAPAPSEVDAGVPGVDDMIAEVERLLRAGDTDRALDLGIEVSTIHPDHSGAHLALGRALLTARRFGDARTAFGAALALSPGLPAAERLLGLAEAGRGRFDLALAAWDRWQASAMSTEDEREYQAEVARWRDAAALLSRAPEHTDER